MGPLFWPNEQIKISRMRPSSSDAAIATVGWTGFGTLRERHGLIAKAGDQDYIHLLAYIGSAGASRLYQEYRLDWTGNDKLCEPFP